jgi:hypothetical protein
MKYRQGFVSNSSTTAFVFLTTQENHLRALEKLTPYERAVVNQVTASFSLGGQKMVRHTDIFTDYGSYCFEDFWLDDDAVEAPDDPDMRNPAKVFEQYEAIAKEQPDQVVSWREG